MTDDPEEYDEEIDLNDLGDPIDELRDLGEDPAPGFLGRLRNTLRRRDLSSQLVTLSWNGLGAVLLEFLQAVFSIFDTNPRDRGGQD